MTAALLGPARVDGKVVDHLEASLEFVRGQNDMFGPDVVLPTVNGHITLAESRDRYAICTTRRSRRRRSPKVFASQGQDVINIGLGSTVLCTARHERERLSGPDSLTELGPIFDFSRARQHYYDASTFAALGEWAQAQREAQAVVDLYTPTHATTWPVTLTLAQINLAHARLHTDGASEALETLQSVLAVPIEQRIPQVLSALRTVRGGIGEHTTNANQRTLAEAIDHFTAETGHTKDLHA